MMKVSPTDEKTKSTVKMEKTVEKSSTCIVMPSIKISRSTGSFSDGRAMAYLLLASSLMLLVLLIAACFSLANFHNYYDTSIQSADVHVGIDYSVDFIINFSVQTSLPFYVMFHKVYFIYL